MTLRAAGTQTHLAAAVALVLPLILTVLVTPLAGEAQQARRLPRIGLLLPRPSTPPRYLEAFRQGLRELGYVEGESIVVELRVASTAEDSPRLVAELVALQVDVLVTWTTPALVAAKTAAGTVPIVGISGDPVLTGLAASLARPGGNVTGFAIFTSDLEPKKLQLLKETVPKVSRVGILWNPDNPVWAKLFERLEQAAPGLGVTLLPLDVRNASELEGAFTRATRQNTGALLAVADQVFGSHAARVAELAAQSRLPMISGDTAAIARAGGLMAYGVDFPDLMRRTATYVDKILKGAKPADLPIEQPTKFEFIVNVRTAKALGLTIPPSILIRADEVIE
jgi:putative tryptophan/tyrosine transport system substrate-binding protein